MSDVEYAQTGETHVAYRLLGEAGRVDVVVVAGALFPFELLAEDRVASRFTNGLVTLGRVAVFDKRGVGLSDPITDWSRSLQEQWADDLIAVTEAAGLDQAVVVSWETYGVARLAASRRPDLFAALVLVNPSASTQGFSGILSVSPGQPVPTRSVEEVVFPSRIGDPQFTAWLARSGRAGASPSSAARIWAHLLSRPGNLTPPGVTTRTLVLHRRECAQPDSEVRAVADDIPGATLVQVDGVDVYPVAGDVDVLTREIAEFVTGGPAALAPLRHVAAVLFTDLVDSTRRAVDEGDEQWRDLLDLHDRVVRECVRHQDGRVVKYTGDGILALVPSVTGALQAAASIRERLVEPRLGVRAAIHVGDVDVRGDDVSGLSVIIAARILSYAEANETLVSEAARQAAIGSAHRFAVAHTTRLKGLPDQWTLHRTIPTSAAVPES